MILEKQNSPEKVSKKNIRLIKSVYHGSATFIITLQKLIQSKKTQKEQEKLEMVSLDLFNMVSKPCNISKKTNPFDHGKKVDHGPKTFQHIKEKNSILEK